MRNLEWIGTTRTVRIVLTALTALTEAILRITQADLHKKHTGMT